MSIKTAYSTKPLPEAITDLHLAYGGLQPRVVIFFASPRYDSAELGRQMQAAFPGATVVGCSTAGEIAGGKMMSGSLAAMFLDDDIIGHTAVAVVENLRESVRISDAFSKLEQQLHTPVSTLDIDRYVGLVLADGLSGAEETLMEKLGDRSNLLFVGGSAGDDLKFESTYVMVDGKSYSNAAALLLLEVKRGFDILKTQSFRSTGKRLVATKVDESRRFVLEFDGVPAIERYAQVLGVSPVDAPKLFMKHPLGLMVQDEPFVRSPQHVEDGGIVFYCLIRRGMTLEVLEATDIVSHTREAIEDRKATGDPISGIIDFHCILRTLQLREENRCDQYGSLFAGIPTAGFSTYGEAYLGHINQTSTMLVFR